MSTSKLTFEHGKQYGTASGAIISIKALITMRGEQYVECYENNNRYRASELISRFRKRLIKFGGLRFLNYRA